MKNHEPNKTALAAALGVSRTTIQRYLAMPGAPRPGKRGWDVSACRTFIASQQPAFDPSTASLREQKIGEEVRKLRLANDRVQGKLVDRDRVMQFWGVMVGRTREIMRQRIEHELPVAIAGLNDVASARVICRRIHDEVLTDMQASVRRFDVDFPPPAGCITKIA